MHRFAVFLLVSAFASTSFGRASVPDPSSMQRGMPGAPATGAGNDTGLTADGKIMLGLDGRGNYRKPKVEKTAKDAQGTTPRNEPNDFRQAMQGQNPATSALTAEKSSKTKPKSADQPATATSGAAPVVQPQPKALRSDKDLFSTKSTAPAVVPNAALPSLQPTSPGVVPNTLPALPTAKP